MLPPEIVDHILGFLHSDEDYTTLEICSAVFPQLAERHLYSRIIFTEYWPSLSPLRTFIHWQITGNVLDINQFSFTLLSRPHIASYVRFVRIVIRTGQALSVILSKLSQITSIALSGTIHGLSWDRLDSRFFSDFQNILRLPSINEVLISNITPLPLNILDCCENLRRLQLFSRCTGGETVSTSFYPRLSSLGVASQTDVTISRVLSWMKTNALHSLSLLVDGRDLSQFRTLIEACSPTLVNLELHGCVYDHDEGLILPVLRVQLPLLERIIIRFGIMIASRNRHSSLPLFMPFLFSIPNTHPIRLCLRLEFLRPIIPNLDWSDVASFLVLPVFRHSIEFDVKSRYDSLTNIVSSFTQDPVLKRLHEMGKLVIKQSVSHIS